ncbi:hypothetical protein ABIG06_002139 [Bradyrhizobium sp. USDA 326]
MTRSYRLRPQLLPVVMDPRLGGDDTEFVGPAAPALSPASQ